MKEFLTVRDAATLLNSSKQTIYNLINARTIKAFNIKLKKTLIKRSEIDKLFAGAGNTVTGFLIFKRKSKLKFVTTWGRYNRNIIYLKKHYMT